MMTTTKAENRVPKHIITAYGGSRKFRIAMRRAVRQAQKAMVPLGVLGSFTFVDPKDVRDVQVLLDRIAQDLSQRNWGK